MLRRGCLFAWLTTFAWACSSGTSGSGPSAASTGAGDDGGAASEGTTTGDSDADAAHDAGRRDAHAEAATAFPTTSGNALVSRGWHLTCAVGPTEKLKCWGVDNKGQIGNGTTTPAGQVVAPTEVLGASQVQAVASGHDFSCVLSTGGAVRCWSGDRGTLFGLGSGDAGGGGLVTKPGTPALLNGAATSLSAGPNHVCAAVDGFLQCWGENWFGQLGNDAVDDGTGAPTSVVDGDTKSPLADVVAVAAGGKHTCALGSTGTVKCWGDNGRGQTAGATSLGEPVARSVTGITGATAVAAGVEFSCAVVAGGAVQCWGDNRQGQLGSGVSSATSTAPVSVKGLTGAVALSLGETHACAVLSDGTARCWGANDTGQLGDGSTTSSDTPVVVKGLTNAVSIAVGDTSSCARLSTGAVRCWGYGAYGELGPGNDSSPVPVAVPGVP